jgi:hypothetical protein
MMKVPDDSPRDAAGRARWSTAEAGGAHDQRPVCRRTDRKRAIGALADM